MTSKEFNDLTATYTNERLAPLGFKQTGKYFYIQNSPNVMVFYEKYFKRMFQGFYLAVTHDFFSNTTDNNGKMKIPEYLEDYPFSVALSALKEQYKKHKTVSNFLYDTNFITREVLTTRQLTKSNPMDIITLDNIQHDKKTADDYIQSSIAIVASDGMKLFNEYSPAISYFAVTRHKSVDNTILNTHKTELENYFKDNKIEIPKRKTTWFNKFR